MTLVFQKEAYEMWWDLYCKVTAECTSKRILKMCQFDDKSGLLVHEQCV